MSFFIDEYDVAVIGAGHAGCEAALASARLGAKTIIFSIMWVFVLICMFFVVEYLTTTPILMDNIRDWLKNIKC